MIIVVCVKVMGLVFVLLVALVLLLVFVGVVYSQSSSLLLFDF